MSTANKISKEIRKASQSNLDLEIGNSVIHTLTNLCGRVIEKSKMGGKQYVSVETQSGRILKSLDRQEFRLCAPGMVSAPVQSASIEAPVGVAVEAAKFMESMLTIDASEGISEVSILDQLS